MITYFDYTIRYHELSEKEILDHLVHQQRYDKRERPPSEGKHSYNQLQKYINLENSKNSLMRNNHYQKHQ